MSATAPGRGTATRTALVVTCVGLAVTAALAAALVPWGAVPGGRPPSPPAGDWFTPAQLEHAEGYSRWARVWSWSGLAASLAVSAWLGFTRRGEALVARLRGPRWLRVVQAVALVLLVVRLATLPLGAGLHELLVRYGLSTQGWAAWGADAARRLGVDVVATAAGVLVVVALVRRLPRAWPAVAGAALGALVVLGSFVYPLLVEPVFNDFAPLEDGELRAQVLELAEREGVEVDDVLVTDASRRTTTLNAYVSGFGSSRRVVLYDTLVDGAPRDETLAVVAHELAHARHGDVLLGTALAAGGAVAAVGLGALLLRRRDVASPGCVPRLLALVAIAGVLVAPAQNGISRQIETRADVDALATTGDPAGFAGLQVRLAVRAARDPSPPAVSQWWFGSHPTTLERLALVGPRD